jgi:hypothetical protein
MGDPFQLPGNSAIKVRMIMSVQIRPDGGVRIEVRSTANVAKHRATTAGDDDGFASEPFAHLREGMPDEAVIEF